MNILRHIKGIATVEFNKKDIVRHKLVQRIVEAYEKENAHIKSLSLKESEPVKDEHKLEID